MGGIWLLDLDAVVRDAGLDYRCWHDWQTRARSSGGYDAVYAVFAHHTASDTSPDSDCAYMWDSTSGDQPIGAMLLDRDGRVTIGCAGATNTQGKGGPWQLSRGTIPQDKGNAYGIAVEAASAGNGEPWPEAQQQAYLVLVDALCRAYDLDVERDVLAHWEWVEPSCPGRKVDPVGPSAWATGAASWDMDAFRRDAAACSTGGGDTDTDEEGDEMALSDDDVNRIAAAVWRYQLTDPTVSKPVQAGDLLEYTRGAAANADMATRAPGASGARDNIGRIVWEHDDRTLST